MELNDYIISNPTRGIPDPRPFKPYEYKKPGSGGPGGPFKPGSGDGLPVDKGV